MLAYGTMAITALEAVDLLGSECRVNVYDARFAKPVDAALIRSLLERGLPVLTVEDHGIHGGFGAAVVEAASEMGLDAGRIVRLALPDRWIYQDSRSRQLAEAGLSLQAARPFNRAGALGWWLNGRVLRRTRISRFQRKVFDMLVPLLTRLDRFLPWPGLGLVAVAVPAAEVQAG